MHVACQKCFGVVKLSVAAACSGSCSTVLFKSNLVMAAKRSVAWRYFQKIDETMAVCDKCGNTVLTSGNTSNLLKVFLESVTS